MSANKTSPFQRVDWQIAQSLWILYFSVTSYLFIALILYLIRHRKETQITRCRGFLMYGMVTLAFIFAVFEMSVNEWGMIHMTRSEETCKSWRQIKHLTFVTSLVPGYIFLWIRQHAFYRDAMLRTMTSKPLKIFSWIVLAMFFIGYAFFMTFFGSKAYTDTHNYIVVNYACYSGQHKSLSLRYYGIASAFTVFYQCSLLFLFTYPIYKSNDDVRNVSSTMSVIFGYLKKCRNLTIISAGTDIFAFLCSTFFKKIWNAPLHLVTAIYDVDLLINLCCILLCLKPWREIVFPWRYCLKKFPAKRQGRCSYVNSELRDSVALPQFGRMLSSEAHPRRLTSQQSNGGNYTSSNSIYSPVRSPAAHEAAILRLNSLLEENGMTEDVFV